MAQKKVGPYMGLKVTPEMMAEIERIAERRGMTRSDVVRMCLDVGLMMHRDLERVGLIQTMDGIQDFVRWCRGAFDRRLQDETGYQMDLPFLTK